MVKDGVKKELSIKKNYKFREVASEKKDTRSTGGWKDATKDEKAKYGNKKYMGTNMSLMKKEV